MDSLMKGRKWQSAGISGDRTQNVLWRIQNGGYEKGDPQTITIAIGINNLTAGDSPKEVTGGIIACANAASIQYPNATIILSGLLPAGLEADNPLRMKYNGVQQALRSAAGGFPTNVKYVDPTGWFVGSDGTLKADLYGGDHLHLSDKGYKVWGEIIAGLLK